MKRKAETISLNNISEEDYKIPVVYPKKITIPLYNWFVPSREIFVKFEKFNCGEENRIFMIGVWYLERNTDRYHNEEPYIWTYRNFLAKSYFEECIIVEEFMNFIKEIGNPRIWYWRDELNIWRELKGRYVGVNFLQCKWASLSLIFISEPVIVRGVFRLDLKEIADIMYRGGLVRTILYTGGDYKRALDVYRSCDPLKDESIIEIENCNKSYVSFLQEMLGYLRVYHR